MMELKDKKVAVIGLSKRTGVSVVRTMVDKGAQVIVSDVKEKSQLKEELALLKNYDLEYELGQHGPKSLESDLIVVSPGVPLDIPFFEKAKQKNIPIISEIELAYNLTEAKIIAITGTNGKTTTTSLTGEIFKKGLKNKVKIAGNIGVPLIKEINGLTSEDWLVVEVSSFQLETINKFRPYISIYLNFSPDHIDRHKSIENYWKAKKKIFSNQKRSDYALVNFDDPEVKRAAENCEAQIFAVSLKDKVKQGVYLENNKLKINISNKNEEIIEIKDIPLKGKHNLENTAFAVLAACLVNIDKNIIQNVIKDYRPHSHRLQEVFKNHKGYTFIDDSKATNPDAAVKALEAVNSPVILIAGGQDRQADFKKLAEIIKKKVKCLILLGETKNKIEKTVLKTGFDNIYKVNNMEEALSRAYKVLSRGDCLLLSPGCPSWDMYSSYKERGNEFVRLLDDLIKEKN